MALRKELTLINAQANAIGDLFNNGKIQLRTGGQPADPNSAASGSLLAEIDLPADAFSASIGGVITIAGSWSGIATGTGTAGWARFLSSDDTISFDVSVAESAADLIIDDEDVVSGGAVIFTSFTITVPDGV